MFLVPFLPWSSVSSWEDGPRLAAALAPMPATASQVSTDSLLACLHGLATWTPKGWWKIHPLKHPKNLCRKLILQVATSPMFPVQCQFRLIQAAWDTREPLQLLSLWVLHPYKPPCSKQDVQGLRWSAKNKLAYSAITMQAQLSSPTRHHIEFAM